MEIVADFEIGNVGDSLEKIVVDFWILFVVNAIVIVIWICDYEIEMEMIVEIVNGNIVVEMVIVI